MEIQKSNLNEQIIKALINKNYGIEIMEIEKINRGTANIFKIKSNDKVYILKEFSEGRTEESVIKETNIINFLKDRGINVPVYIKSKQNSFYIKFENRIIILQECIDGYTMEIYMVHMMFMYMPFCLVGRVNLTVGTVLIIIATVISAWILKKVENILIKNMHNLQLKIKKN